MQYEKTDIKESLLNFLYNVYIYFLQLPV